MPWPRARSRERPPSSRACVWRSRPVPTAAVPAAGTTAPMSAATPITRSSAVAAWTTSAAPASGATMPEPRRERRLFWRWLALALVVVVLDQWTKHLRSEEHTSELQSRGHLVCRLLLEKKNRTLTTLSFDADGMT